jgi:hypothetical protein
MGSSICPVNENDSRGRRLHSDNWKVNGRLTLDYGRFIHQRREPAVIGPKASVAMHRVAGFCAPQ